MPHYRTKVGLLAALCLPLTDIAMAAPGAGTGAPVTLLLNNGQHAVQQPAIYQHAPRGLSYRAKKHAADLDGLHLEMAGIRVPESEYNFIERPVAPSGTYIFYFDFASAVIHEDQLPAFDRIIETYNNRAAPITVIGETDGFGSQTYNVALATHRSRIIIDELVRRGIAPDHIREQYKVRCCRPDSALLEAVQASRGDRITWVHFD